MPKPTGNRSGHDLRSARHIRLPLALLILGSAWGATASTVAQTPAEWLAVDQLLQQPVRGDGAAATFARAGHLLTEGLRKSAGDRRLEHKHDLLAARLQDAVAFAHVPAPERAPPAPAAEIQWSGAARPGCAQALSVDLHRPIGAALPSGGEFWLRVPAGSAPLGLTTAGSTLDAGLQWYTSCGSEAVQDSDDNNGLQAFLVVPPMTAGFLRVLNHGPAGRVRLSPSAIGTIAGRVRDEKTGNGIENIEVRAYSSLFGGLGQGFTGSAGTYSMQVELGNQTQDTLFLRTAAFFGNSTYAQEGYNGIPCDSVNDFNGLSHCQPALLTGVQLAAGATVANIDFDLPKSSRLLVRVASDGSGAPIANANVQALGASGAGFSVATDAAGRAFLGPLHGQSTYRVAASASQHLPEAYDNIPCPSFGTCTELGQPLSIAAGTTRELRMSLSTNGAIGTPHVIRVQVEPEGEVPLLSMRLHLPNGLLYQEQFASGGIFSNLAHFPAGQYRLVLTGDGVLPEVFEDIPCSGLTCSAELLQGDLVTLPLTADLEITLTRSAAIRGRVSGQGNVSVANIGVAAIPVSGGTFTETTFTNSAGEYRFEGLIPGSYRVRTDSDLWVDEEFPDQPCDQPLLIAGCEQGTVLTLGALDVTADFVLNPSGRLQGSIAGPGGFASAALLTPLGSVLAQTSGFGSFYEFRDVPPGTYRVAAYQNESFPQVYPGQNCPAGNPFLAACPPGSPVVVTSGETTTGIDFGLLARGMRIRIRDAQNQTPLPGIAVDAWNDLDQRVATGVSDALGVATINVFSGSFKFSTDNTLGFLDEVYNDIPCPLGSAFLGQCSLAAAQLVDPTPWTNDPETPPLEILLGPRIEDLVFRQGFE